VDALDHTFFLKEQVSGWSMGLYQRITVQFSEDQYNAANVPNSEFIFVLREDGKTNLCNRWQSLDRAPRKFFDGSRAFKCSILTSAWEAPFVNAGSGEISESDIKDIITDTIGKVLGVDESITQNCQEDTGLDLFGDSSHPCAYQIFQGEEEFKWHGSWSAFKVGWTNDDYECVTASHYRNDPSCPVVEPNPVEDPVLFFAGESYCPRFQGFQHGAYLSGIHTATDIIKLKLGDDDFDIWEPHATPEFCFEAASGGPGNWFVKKSKATP
jgi:hypothetical protein